MKKKIVILLAAIIFCFMEITTSAASNNVNVSGWSCTNTVVRNSGGISGLSKITKGTNAPLNSAYTRTYGYAISFAEGFCGSFDSGNTIYTTTSITASAFNNALRYIPDQVSGTGYINGAAYSTLTY